MGDTKIQWTNRVWNPVTGCAKVSPGCDHCYAEGIAHRFAGQPAFPNGFDLTLHPERVTAPLRWRKPSKVFVNSMSDLFHDAVPQAFIARVFAVMALAPRHTFQILTKRHGRMRSLLKTGAFVEQVQRCAGAQDPDFDDPPGWWPLPNVWMGVSVEDQQRAELRIPALLQTPAAVRFLSCEPLLGPVDLAHAGWLAPDEFDRTGIGWVIVGGESGPGARPMYPDWARQLRDQCRDADVPYFFKQWGRWAPRPVGEGGFRNVTRAGEWRAYDPRPSDMSIPMAPTYKAPITLDGRALDGRTWDEFPKASTTAGLR